MLVFIFIFIFGKDSLTPACCGVGVSREKVFLGNYDYVWGSILVNLECPVGKMVTMSGALFIHHSPSHPFFRSFSFSWSSASFLIFPFSPKLQIDNSTVQFKHISMNYFVWGSIHHLILFSTHQLLSFFFPKLQNVNLHIHYSIYI